MRKHHDNASVLLTGQLQGHDTHKAAIDCLYICFHVADDVHSKLKVEINLNISESSPPPPNTSSVMEVAGED